MRIKSLISIVALATALAGSQAQASPVLTWGDGTFIPDANVQTVGWTFAANQAINVSALDWYDPTPFNSQHTVDIWTSSGGLLGSACVGSGCVGSVYSGSYWSTPVSLSLAAGSYVIGGNAIPGEPWQYAWTIYATDPAITYGNSVYALGSGTNFPNSPYGTGIVGPNFEISSTPLPSTWLMLFSGFAGFGFLAYRGTKKNSAAIAAA